MAIADELTNFIYAQVDTGFVFEGNASYACLGDEHHYYYVWAMSCSADDIELLVAQFKRDIEAWVSAAGSQPTIVVRSWPESEPITDDRLGFLWVLRARLIVLNRFYRNVPPSFMPKPEGDEPQMFGGTDES